MNNNYCFVTYHVFINQYWLYNHYTRILSFFFILLGLIQYMASLNLTKRYVEKFIKSERQQKRRQVADEDFTATSDRLNRLISIVSLSL